MNSDEFKGVCPLCYKPINANESSHLLEDEDQKEAYHADCLLDGWRVHGVHLKNRREFYGLSISDVARQLWVLPSRIEKLENGEHVRDSALLLRCYLYMFEVLNQADEIDSIHNAIKISLQGSDGE